MTTTAAAPTITMRPYQRQGEIDYARLDFDPDEPVLKPDAMQQNLQLEAVLVLLRAHCTDFNRRPDVFLDSNTIICYDPTNLNVCVSPDVYLAFGVDTRAIRRRKIYLPWEVGKPPDWVLEVASSSTSREDVGRKRDIYARIGVPEYWRFDPKDGEYHGQRLGGDRLVGGGYQPIELTTAPDGILKGHSEILGLSLCWDDNWPRLYDPATDTYLEGWPEVWEAREAAEAQIAVEQAGRLAERAARRAAESHAATEQAAREAAEARIRQLEAELRRRRADG
ncbi:MAG: Uma2 family endonuclease [Chloroflexota bacterium]|nr:Uma2 family endonuclease [Chloroflexota bacterium]